MLICILTFVSQGANELIPCTGYTGNSCANLHVDSVSHDLSQV